MEDLSELFQKLGNFCKINEQFNIFFKDLDSKKNLNNETRVNLMLVYIAKEIIIIPQYFEKVLEHFAKETPKLLIEAVAFSKDFPFSQPRHIINCILLSKITKARPDLKSYAQKYFQQYASPFEEDLTSSSKAKKCRITLPYNIYLKDLNIVEACYFLLKSDAKFYRRKWKWSIFIKKYSLHTDYKVSWLACQTIAIILGLNESSLKSLISQRLSEDLNLKLTIEFDKHESFTKNLKDINTLDQHPLMPRDCKKAQEVVNISGIYILALSKPKRPLLIEVPSTHNNLRKIAISLSCGKAFCLQGPVGSGKTGLIEHLAACSGRELGDTFIKVQLGDQTDSKMLLGTYRCSEIPGEFVWQPGVLTQAVIEGNWLLLEDIDLVSMDIASVLASLLENNALTVPGYRDLVPVTPGFQLFLTQRLIISSSGQHKRHSNAMYLLEKHVLQITIDPLTVAELRHILHVKYPQFDTIAERLNNVFALFCSSRNDESYLVKRPSRLISIRDFFKWCSRAAINYNVKSPESALRVLQDAIDVFCCSIPSVDEALGLAKEISTQLGIINQKAEYFFSNYKPTMKLTSDSFQSDRVSLNREHSIYSKQTRFCFTRPSAVLLERIMCCVNLKEPVLLVGETGTGKTSSVQYLAHTLGKKLTVINMNQQSDSVDLLGGFKPVDLRIILAPIRTEFEAVFKDFFNTESNKEFLNKIAFAFNKQKVLHLISMMQKSTVAALKRLSTSLEAVNESRKKKKDQDFCARWQSINEKLKKVEVQLKQGNALYFAFIEGSLVKAVQEGSWVLLDEINLATAETLECLSGLLENTCGSVCLLERGDKTPIKRHQNFTLFACMNPATNVGKKDLPTGLRNRFTEFYVDELTEKSDLILLVSSYLEAMALDDREVSKIVDFYLRIRKEMNLSLCDGMGHKPHFSLRSLCRALMTASKNPCGTFKRSLYEAFCLSFLTQLDARSYDMVQGLVGSYLIGDEKKVRAILKKGMPEPKESGNIFLEFEGYWIKKGNLEPISPDNYILTSSVRKNLKDLARVVSIGKLPVLLQGDTSVGKTSLITYLAKSSGNKCVRINNHEHTDLQEYIGSYVADSSGKLVFREGVLVDAMRNGNWIILDELNLAPTDVLEALNRVLDDNRELFIPETQDTVKADPNFMLFATQNPPGVYGGRKMLSRAFRNRFVELHFNEIPPSELESILHQRCAMPLSYAKKMIIVMTDLQVRRRGSAAFAGKQGFITLRDLFRWGERYRLAQNSAKLYDWDQHLADEGYLVLAGKVRKNNEKKEIVDVLQKHWRRKVILERLFSLNDKTSTVTKHILQKFYNNSARYPNIVWTFNMRKLAVLIGKALEFKEPVLLVGETGGGKTTMCQLIAEINGQELTAVNCHMHTESSDFIGGLRPVREHSKDNNSLFEWVDGPLLNAMRKGSVFLADEISLADDSVLERLNSLLEPERTLLLSEKGIDLNNPNNSETLVAHQNFIFIGTMNPGGDFGKKELSPALRNRFTEVWCELCTDRDDLVAIINKNLQINPEFNFGEKMIEFIDWFRNTEIGKRYTVSIRDILTWVNFINQCTAKMCSDNAYIHGAHLVFLDSLGSGVSSNESLPVLETFKTQCLKFLNTQFRNSKASNSLSISLKIVSTDLHFGIEPFYVTMGEEKSASEMFSFDAPTTISNTRNLLRGMQLNKAILLEGSPGVGKTSLITVLAKLTRHKIFRVNLSDQTDISDLFGADLPLEGGTGGQFTWRDGPLLQALREGCWILLDELNLASQSVLEGLNACLDHRGEIFIPELAKTFHVRPGTRFFACQNPMKEGGSRRGLPKSFLNRFIQVYISAFSFHDMEIILTNQFPSIPDEILKKMIDFNYKLATRLNERSFGNKGSPWECNLRDLIRWCQATLRHFESNPSSAKRLSPEYTAQLIYIDRMRSIADKKQVEELYKEVMGCAIKGSNPVGYIEEDQVHFGEVCLKRGQDKLNDSVLKQGEGHLILRGQQGVLRSLTYCVNQNWMAILVGNSGVGKSSVVKTLANLAGKSLRTLPVTSAMDTTDILGGFEQTNYSRHLEEIAKEVERLTLTIVQDLLIEEQLNKAVFLLEYWEEYLSISDSSTLTMKDEVQLFTRKLAKLEGVLKELYMKCNSSEEGNVTLELLNKCSKIFQAVNHDKSLNAGGRFEWVDSVLVKCLQEGSWLVVDNVNLCSAAVLDRLNGLLEPNGVLTVSERGVDENGKMFVVEPHKDFRIFLTMDPKNGEISRAMRNRGVEIYMLNDSELATANNFDLLSLIDLKGLSNPKLIKTLLKVHEFISNLILSEKPKIIDIIQCSALISQQMRHGIDIFQAFSSACIEIYCKTRNPCEFNCNNVLEVMQSNIRRCLDTLECDADLFCSNVTLNTNCLERWSNLEKVKHQASLYVKAIKVFEDVVQDVSNTAQENVRKFVNRMGKVDSKKGKKDVSIWSDIESIKIQNEFVEKSNLYMLANLLSISFTLTSKKDLDYGVSYLRSAINQPQWLGAIERFNKVVSMFVCKDPNLPHDDRWINDSCVNDCTCNAINYALQLEVFTFTDSLQHKLSPNNSLYNYLLAVRNKEVPKSVNNPICENYLDLRTNHFRFMKKMVSYFATDSTDFGKKVFELLELLSWRLALHGYLTCVRMPQQQLKGPSALEGRMDLLTLYYKWFYKHSVERVAKLYGVRIPKTLRTILDNINKKIEEEFSITFKLASNYKKLNEVPDFYTSETQLVVLDLIQSYDLFSPKNNLQEIVALFKSSPEYRQSLINLKLHLHSGKDTKDELSELQNVSVKKNGQILKEQITQVLPLVDFLMQMLVMGIIKTIKSKTFGNLSNINRHILLNVDFNGVLMAYKETGDARLLHEIKKGFYWAAGNSPSTCPHKFIHGIDNGDMGVSIAGAEPLYLKAMVPLVVSLDDKSVVLGNYMDVHSQRHYLRALLWDNIHALCEDKFDFVSVQKEILDFNVKTFLDRIQSALNSSISNQISNSVLHALVANIEAQYQKLIKYFRSLENRDFLLSCLADIHLNLGFAELYLNSLLPRIDPLAKKAMKKNHLVSVVSMFEQMQKSFELQSSVFSKEEGCRHPYYNVILELITNLKLKVDKYGDNTNAGVKTYAYSYVVQQIKYASSNVFKTSILEDINTCTGLLNDIKSTYSDSIRDKIQRFIDIFQTSITNYDKIFQDWQQYRGSYPDIVEPLLANICQFIYGFKLKLFWIKRELIKVEYEAKFKFDLETELLRLVALPSLSKDVPSLNILVDHYTAQRNGPFSSYVLRPEQASYIKNDADVRLLKCEIQESFNQCIVEAKGTQRLDEASLENFNKLVDAFINLWNEQERAKEKENTEAENLYKTRTKCDEKPEEEQIEDDLNELFPNYHVLDFADFQEKQFADSTIPTQQHETSSVSQITENDLKFVIELHSKLYRNFTRTEWLSPEVNKNIQVDYVSPLMEKYKLVRQIIEGHPHYFQYKLDSELCASLSVLLEVSMKYGCNDSVTEFSSPRISKKQTKGFYKNPDIGEVKTCLPVLDNLGNKIRKLLQEWPDQPTLKSILTVIERVLNFDIRSPISRYLTGLDILLSKCHEWEQVAHSGVSLINEIPELVEKIIEWRKMELNQWKELLNTTYTDLTKPLNNWWLKIYNILKQYTSEAQISESDLVDTLQKFITKSPLVEFQGRLELLMDFHCYAIILPKTPQTESFTNILWNIYNYFNQFSSVIGNKIKDLRSPIERKLKDYVKIARWKDVNYWSVKDTVEKTHKALHKFVREYRALLLQPVVPHLNGQGSDNVMESVGIWDRPQRQNPKAHHYTLDADTYIVKASVKDSPYMSKARKLCKETIMGTDYPNLVKSLDAFATDIIETSSYLNKLELDTTLPKEKQRSQAKNILNQKHRALADLFQALSKSGVSFRTGIMDRRLKNLAEDFRMQPINLTASFGSFGLHRIDDKILIIWDSCELYYYRSLLRYDILETALITPSQDFGVQNVERCRGFAAHLLCICQDQKRNLIKATRLHYKLRRKAKVMRETCENEFFISAEALLNIKKVLSSTSVVLSQVQIILNSCPDDATLVDNSYLEIPLLESDKSVMKRKEDEHWKKTKKLIDNVESLLGKLQSHTQKIQYKKTGFIPFAVKDCFFEDFQKLATLIDTLQQQFQPIKVSQSLNWLATSIRSLVNEYSHIQVESAPHVNYENLLDKFTKSLLIVIQNIYKKYRGLAPSSKQSSEIDPSEETPLQDDHLKVLLSGNLQADLSNFEASNVLNNTELVLETLLEGSNYPNEEERSLTAQCLPLFDQVLHLSEYFITQQVAAYRTTCKLTSILLNIFIDLASKGFCIPPELSDELDKQGNPSEGLGLGEGQGERNVSDKIESEDQLDDTQPAGQEKKNEDSDCKEEDNGIEMSEDFDSKLQDKKSAGEDDEEQSDDSDVEEQAGETEKGADELDQEIWGDDKDEKEDQEENDQTKEEGTGGERDGEDQMEARDDSTKKSKNDDLSQSQKDNSEQNKPEINEINESDFDDEQIDPYHGNQPEPPEPEPMDLPDDFHLDEGEEKNEEQPENNPFDIDEMKEHNISESELEQPEIPKEQQHDEEKCFSSDDEEVTIGKDVEKSEGENDDKNEEENSGQDNTEEPVIPQKENDKEDTVGDSDKDESALDQTQSNQENVEAMEVNEADAADKTQATQSENLKSEQALEEIMEEDKPDKEGVGQSQMEENVSGHSVQANVSQDLQSSSENQENEKKRKERPGESDLKRSLGDINQPVQKKLKAMEAHESASSEQQQDSEKQKADMYEHIKEATEEPTTQILDVATKEQAEEQRKKIAHEENVENDEKTKEDEETSSNIPAEEEEEMDINDLDTQNQKSVKQDGNKDKSKHSNQHSAGEILEEIQDTEIEGDTIKTSTVSRPADSQHYTQFHLLQDNASTKLNQEQINAVRNQVKHELSSWKSRPTSAEAEQTWQKISSVTSNLAQDLSEQLRLVLEPTQASHLKGDYRTGRRINMRKIIPYIASQFRKDKIWLRRTKPSKREYQIVLAIDDSSSMADNHSKELAFESVALISKALSLLESGQLAVVSFGENIEILHKLSDPFTDMSGMQLLQSFQFGQQKTYIGKLMDFVTEMFEENNVRASIPNAKLLLIVSDGRGVFSEGENYVCQAVRRTKLSDIFTVFVIIDSPENKSSILDIRSTTFSKDGKLLGFCNYMDEFPFPFYIVLRDINSLPGVLSDALMQWFEMVTSQS
ncbi:midasin [Euwallacea fornicatus]|uniref:midasin n=1 Tax=Euwallacea fornicatus TaxID=995702 RepID=UPI00338F3F9C